MLNLNQVYNGDCLELMRDIDDQSIDMILCDLPYGKTACKWDTVIPFEPLWKEYKRIIKPNGAIVLTACQPFTSQLIMSNPKMFRYEWIWEKNNSTGFLDANRKPLRIHENICVFYKKLPIYNPQGLIYKNVKKKTNRKRLTDVYRGFKLEYISKGYNYPKTVLKFKSERGLHPTQKPVALFEYLIKTYTNEGDLVLDNCAGAGTTAIAAINSNRNYILIEKDNNYYNLCKKRINEHGEKN